MHAREVWTPVRSISADQQCYFCWCRIARGKPGRSTGDRGTKAFYCHEARLWQCLECHAEHVRAEIARNELRRAQGEREAGTGTPGSGPSPQRSCG